MNPARAQDRASLPRYHMLFLLDDCDVPSIGRDPMGSAAGRVTLDRPNKSNSLHPDLISSLAENLKRTDRDDDIRVALLTGSGTSFCAGLDLDHLVRSDTDGTLAYMRSAFALFRQVYELRQPVVAAMNGPAIAGGFDLAAFCDIRLCSTTARFAQEILLGLTQISTRSTR